MSGAELKAQAEPLTHTSQPIVTGTSVIAIKFADGIMMAADTLASYGSLARFSGIQRMKAVGGNTVVGASGEYSDFQYISDALDEMTMDDFCTDDGKVLTSDEIHSYLTRLMYSRRNKQQPLWNGLLVGGFKGDSDEAYLGYVDMIGTSYTDDFLCTGFAKHLAVPILRERWRADLTAGEARALLEDCMRVMFYRDCRASREIQLAQVTKEGALVSGAFKLDTKWDYAMFVAPKAGMDTDGSW
jgi:20S proteasome subunit beta 7